MTLAEVHENLAVLPFYAVCFLPSTLINVLHDAVLDYLAKNVAIQGVQVYVQFFFCWLVCPGPVLLVSIWFLVFLRLRRPVW